RAEWDAGGRPKPDRERGPSQGGAQRRRLWWRPPSARAALVNRGAAFPPHRPTDGARPDGGTDSVRGASRRRINGPHRGTAIGPGLGFIRLMDSREIYFHRSDLKEGITSNEFAIGDGSEPPRRRNANTGQSVTVKRQPTQR